MAVRFTPEQFEALVLAEDSNGSPPPASGGPRRGPVDETVKEGSRTSTIVSLTGTMLRRGLGVEEILPAMLAANEHRFEPPLPEKEVRETVKEVCRRYQHQTGSFTHGADSREDDGDLRAAVDIIIDLLAQDTIGAGDAFKPGSVKALATVKIKRPDLYENMREKLKEADVRVSALDELVQRAVRHRVPDVTPGQSVGEELAHILEAERGSQLQPQLVRKVANLVIDRLVDQGAMFAHSDAEVFLFWRSVPHLVSDNLEFLALLWRLTGLNFKTPLGRVVVEELRYHGYSHGVKTQPTWWTATDLGQGVTYFASDPGTVLALSESGISVQANGEKGVCLLIPIGMEPFDFDPRASISTAIAQLDKLVMKNLPLPRAAALVATATIIAAILRGYCSTRPISHFTGSSSAGKTSAARLLGMLIFGRDVISVYTTATLFERASSLPLLILDNKESANLSRAELDFLLVSSTGATRSKRAMESDRDVVDQQLDALVALTSIEPLPTHELQTRLWQFVASSKHKNARFDEKRAGAEILRSRERILSGLLRMLARDVLPVINDGGLDDLKDDLVQAGIVDRDDRTGHFLALVAAILEPICQITGDDLTSVLREWQRLRNRAAREASVGTNAIVSWLDTLAHQDRARAQVSLPFVVTNNAGITTFRCTTQELLLAFRAVSRWTGTKVPWQNERQLGCRLRSERRVLAQAGWRFRRAKSHGRRMYEFTGDGVGGADPRSGVAKRFGSGGGK